MSQAKPVAVVMSGCGFLDGSEIHEATSVLIHLDLAGKRYVCFAPDSAQAGVVNHATGEATNETRGMLAESARIARGQITPLQELKATAFSAVIFPGGFGAAKNLCNFAVHGSQCKVLPEVARVIKEFHAAGKPMGFCCIAPVLAARVLGTASGGPGVTVTLGEAGDASREIEKLGAKHEAKAVEEVCIDRERRVVTTPAYMYETTPGLVFKGIGRMVEDVVRMVG